MPIVIRANEAKYKSEATGEYEGFNVIGEVTTDELVAEINVAGATQLDAVNGAGETQVDNVEAAGAEQVSAVNDTGATQVGAVNTAGETQVAAVNTEGATQLNTLNTAGETQLNAVNTAGATQVGLVNAEGATQVQAVEDKGAEVLESIPDDYEEKMDQVNDYLENLVVVSDTQPESESNKLWIEDQEEEEIEVPLYTEFEDVANAVDDLKNSLNLTTNYKTVSGNIATFEDGADNRRIRKIVGTIEPVQDLHGYDAPWPAGGGVNQYDNSLVTFWDKGYGLLFEPAGQYIRCHGTYTGTSATLSLRACIFNNSAGLTGVVGFPISGFNTELYRIRLYDNNIAIDFVNMVQNTAYDFVLAVVVYDTSLSAPTAWTPYSNECPISGWTGANVTGIGKNLFNPVLTVNNKYVRAGNTNESAPLGSETDNNTLNCSDYVRVKPLTQYTTYVPKFLAASAAGLVFYSSNTVDSAISGVSTGTQGGAVYTFTTPENCNYIRFSWDNRTPEDGTYPYPTLVEGTDATYQPYKSQTLSVNWQDTAGTIYGGTVTLNEDGSADVVATKEYAKLSAFTWSYFSDAGYFRTTTASVSNYANDVAPLSEIYKTALAVTSGTPDINIGWAGARLAVRDSRYTDANLWVAAVGDYGVAVQLTPANQTTYHFDNIGELYNYLGTNNVWIDSGSITELVYNAGSNVALTEDVNDPTTGLASKAPAIVNTVSGNVVSISDGAEGIPVKKIVGTIEPVQDLHGYANPWPAGGGKNLWDGTFNEYIPMQFASGTRLCMQAVLNDTSKYLVLRTYDSNKTFLQSVITPDVSGNINYGLLTLTSDVSYIKVEKSSDITATNVMLSIASSVQTYQPYENICPISGWIGANVYKAGINMWNGQYESGTISTATGQNESTSSAYQRAIGYFPVKGGETYYFVGPEVTKRFFWYDSNYNYIGCNIQTTPTRTAPSNACFARIFWKTANVSDPATMISINYPSTETAFCEYVEPNSIPINWQSEAGTIYSGMVTLNDDGSADLVNDMASLDLGSLSWSYHPTQNRFDYDTEFGCKKPSNNSTAVNLICSIYIKSDANSINNNNIAVNTNGYLRVKDKRYTTASEFKSAISGQIVVYPLAAPQTYHFDNIGQLRTFLGTNNIWTDCGSISELNYVADTKTYIDANGGTVGDIQIIRAEKSHLTACLLALHQCMLNHNVTVAHLSPEGDSKYLLCHFRFPPYTIRSLLSFT